MMLKMIYAGLIALSASSLAPSAVAQEMIRVGVTTTGIPFTFIDTASQEPTGAMVDLASAIAADVGMEAAFKISAFPALIPALTSEKIDLISAAMFATEEREKIIDFSVPVYSFGEAMFVAAEDDNNYTIDDLEGETVGAPIGSTTAHALEGVGIFGEIRLYDSISDIMRDVKLGRVKAGFGDRPIVAYQISQNPGLGVRLVDGYDPLEQGKVALAVAQGNVELLEKVNVSIAELKENGRLQEIFAKYGL